MNGPCWYLLVDKVIGIQYRFLLLPANITPPLRFRGFDLFLFPKRSSTMRRLGTIVALYLIISPLASADQALSLTYSICNNIVGTLLSARWGPNANQCQWPTNGGMVSNSQNSPFKCISQACVNNCTASCQNCDQKICAAATITVDNSCTQLTSPLWITTVYTGGGPHCGPRGEGC